MQISYHVEPHDEGWAYRCGNVWSEPYPTHEAALAAAKIAAARQQVGGSDEHIVYETSDYKWRSEDVKGGDRPEVDVQDEYPGLA